jgi:hypothetical protein
MTNRIVNILLICISLTIGALAVALETAVRGGHVTSQWIIGK